MPIILLFAVFVVATCGLIYELVAGTLASYLLGDSVTQFSTIIGCYLFAMGIGSFFSKYFNTNLLSWFIKIELLVGLVGGTSSTLLFLLFEQVESFRILLYFIVTLTGVLVGLEIPLLMRILEDKVEFKELVSQIFTFDYIGALAASIIFPLILVPQLGILKTSYLFGLLNTVVALFLCYKFEDLIITKYLKGIGYLVLFFLLAGFVYADSIMSFAESASYKEKIIFSKSSAYQRIIITKNSKDVRMYLNGNLQFNSTDEYRYHEALVHLPIQYSKKINKVLILGGGDGMAARELLKYPAIKSIDLIDLDKSVTDLFKTHPMLTELNHKSLLSSKVKIHNLDAFVWLKTNKEKFDLIVIDFPDPSNYSVGKLYSTTFYKELYKSMEEEGLAVIQSTSPYVAPNSFWCIYNTIQEVGFSPKPYHVFIPSFGDWGYVMLNKTNSWQKHQKLASDLRFVDDKSFEQLSWFPKDIQHRKTELNKLNNQALVHYFEKEWNQFLQ
jgi:spermidine synthase